MIKNILRFTFLTLLSVLLASILKAQDTSNTETDSIKILEKIIVSPFKINENYPLSVTTLARKELLKRNYGQEPSFLQAQTPSVTVFSDAGSYNGYSYFRIRGIDQTRINTTLNGVPLNEPEDQGVFFSNYPDFLESVGSLQIHRGAGYSKPGIASYGGSIAIESMLFKDSAAKQISAGYGSFNIYRINAVLNTGLYKKIGLYTRTSYLNSDGYKEHSNNTSASTFVNAGYWGNKHKIYFFRFCRQSKKQTGLDSFSVRQYS